LNRLIIVALISAIKYQSRRRANRTRSEAVSRRATPGRGRSLAASWEDPKYCPRFFLALNFPCVDIILINNRVRARAQPKLLREDAKNES
jgi:hypothetical protein